MDVGTFCAQSQVLVVAGKGGVGKTTMTAALARMAAEAGLSVLLVELEGKSGLGGGLRPRGDLDYEEACSRPRHPARRRRRARSGAGASPPTTRCSSIWRTTACSGSPAAGPSGRARRGVDRHPGIRDVLVLGKVKQLEREDAADLILVDAPATGHAVTFLTSAAGCSTRPGAGRSGPRPRRWSTCSSDPARCRVVLVTLPEELPVCETIESAYTLED